jgi:hypothetical protein
MKKYKGMREPARSMVIGLLRNLAVLVLRDLSQVEVGCGENYKYRPESI